MATRATTSFAVTMLGSGEPVSTATYMPTRHDPALIPFDWYLALCIAGAREHSFDAAMVSAFRTRPPSNRILSIIARPGWPGSRHYRPPVTTPGGRCSRIRTH